MQIIVIVFALVFFTCVAVGLSATLLVDKRRRLRRARLAGLGSAANTVATLAQSPASPAQSRRAAYTAVVAQRIQKAGLSVTPQQLILLGIFVAVVLSLIAFLLVDVQLGLGLRAVLAAVGATITSFLAFSVVLRVLEQRRIAAFRASLPEAIETMARSLRAGRAASDAVGLIGSAGDDLLAMEFRRCRNDIQHGSTLRVAIESLAERVDVPDMHFIASAISLQHTSGGNLAETLDIAAQSLRQFRQLEAKARALSAEVRMSAVILTALPILVGAALSTLNPEYLGDFVEDTRGRILLGYAVFSLGCGLFIMKRMERVDD